MKAPRVVRLLSQRYKVGFWDRIHIEDKDGNTIEDAANGSCDRNVGYIAIRRGLGHDVEREVYLHESLHAMIGASGLHQDLLKSDDMSMEEAVVNRLAPILLSWLRDNPRIIEYLRSRQ